MFRRPNTSITNYLNFLFNILMLTLGNEYKKQLFQVIKNINFLNFKDNNQIADYLNLFRSRYFLNLQELKLIQIHLLIMLCKLIILILLLVI